MGISITGGESAAGWRYLAVSCIGSSHVESGVPCQDASLAVHILPDSILLVAADGAGSAKFADEGAQIACNSIHEAISAHVAEGGRLDALTADHVDRWLEAVVARLHIQANAREVGVRELACTLVVAIASPSVSHFFQVGDGAIVVRREAGLEPATWPANGEYANTTYFVTDDRAQDNLFTALNQPPVEDVALLTDGLQTLALQFAERRVHEPFFEGFFHHLKQQPAGNSIHLSQLMQEYLGSPVVNKRTDDDKTLLLASLVQPPPVK